METQSRLASLPARPPTPPRDTRAESDPILPSHPNDTARATLDTPLESPHSVDYLSKSCDKGQKRVDFRLDAHTIDERIRTLLKSSKPCKPSKSILKFSSNPASSAPAEPDFAIPECRDFATMLDDTLRALASSSQMVRFDAYMALNGCLKAYSDTPSHEELFSRLPALAECQDTILKEMSGIRSSSRRR